MIDFVLHRIQKPYHGQSRVGRARVCIRVSVLTVVASLMVSVLTPAASVVALHTSATPDTGTSVQQREVASSGAWCWFADPRAVFYQGSFRRTYAGWITQRGEIQVAAFDEPSGQQSVSTLASGFEVDDHDAPSILIRPDGRLMVFWSAHSGPKMFYRMSTNPEDISSWNAVQTVGVNTPGNLGYTYANPIQLSAENNRLYLFWRGGDFEPTLSTTLDGVTWSPATQVVNTPGQRPYAKFASDDVGTIGMAFTDGNPGETVTSLYYAVYQNGAWSRADGTLIATSDTLPFAPSQADLIWDAHVENAKAWIYDLAYDENGYPVMVFAYFPSAADHHYRYARWDGSRWQTFEISSAGGSIDTDHSQPYYSGGITLDHEDPSTLYLSKSVNGVFEIQTWQTLDGGQSWTSQAVTSDSQVGNYRPVVPRHHQSDTLGLLWTHGTYPSYTVLQTSIQGLFPTAP